VIITAGGFAETDIKGRELQNAIVEISRRSGLRLIGPNTMGIINTRKHLNATFSPDLGGSVPGNIGVISQSGSICETLFSRSQERGFGLSIMIASGNEADLDLCDYLEYMIDDPGTSVISTYVEQIRRPGRFIDLVRKLSSRKPIVIFRTGRTERGVAAVSSHTGALAGNDEIMSGLCKQLGLVETRSYQEFIDASITFAGDRYPKGKRLAIVTGPGAPGVAACDKAVEEGLIMASLGPEAEKRLENILPSIASWRNPIDLTGKAATHPELVAQTLNIVLEDNGVDGVILIFGLLSSPQGLETVIHTIRGQSKPVLAVTVASLTQNEDNRTIIERLGQNRIPSFFTPEQAVHAFKILAETGRNRRL
jgi:acetyltransferase